MTLNPFIQLGQGESVEVAFDSATHRARLAFGTNGFTGTLADKGSFILIRAPRGVEALGYAERLLKLKDPRICEMWSPAGAIFHGPGAWWFFGFSAV